MEFTYLKSTACLLLLAMYNSFLFQLIFPKLKEAGGFASFIKSIYFLGWKKRLYLSQTTNLYVIKNELQ